MPTDRITKKVRLMPAEAARLARLARQEKVTESEILREGLDMVDRRHRRRKAVEQYIEFLGDEKEPPKVRFRLR